MKKAFILILFSILIIQAQQPPIHIGTKIAEPFVIKEQDGDWSGISFDLWKGIAEELHVEYDVKEYSLSELLSAVESGDVDMAVSPLTITSTRESQLDFTHPYYITGLNIAVPLKEESGLFSLFMRIISVEFFEAIGILILILLLVGLLTWLFERKANPGEFGDGRSKGLWSSFWFAAVTMTTVGYGDKSPKSLGGRLISLIWMFAAIIIISGITASIASALTVTQLDSKVQGLNDLYDVNVGTIGSSSAATFLDKNKIGFSDNKSVSEGLTAVANGEIDAFVYDAPLMKYLIKKNKLSSKIKVLPVTLEQVYYAYALPPDSELREKINRILIEKINSDEWKDILYDYFGNQ